jgi:acetyl/propionyl-CoA carboxylase alpha subunit
MPRDFIDALTHANHLARLNLDREAAQAEYDDAALRAATDESAKPALSVARAKLEDSGASIDALNRARELSEEKEAEAAAERAAAERRNQARQALKDRKEAEKLAKEIDKDLAQLIVKHKKMRTVANRSGSTIHLLVSGRPRERIVHDTLSHQVDGAYFLGQLRKAGVPGLDLDICSDPIDAMRTFGDKTLAGLVGDRIDHAIRLASTDAPELRGDSEGGN